MQSSYSTSKPLLYTAITVIYQNLSMPYRNVLIDVLHFDLFGDTAGIALLDSY